MDNSSHINWKISVIEAIFYNDVIIESHDQAPRGFPTRANESGIQYYQKRELALPRMVENLYVIHPDDLAMIRKHYPKQIPIQMEEF